MRFLSERKTEKTCNRHCKMLAKGRRQKSYCTLTPRRAPRPNRDRLASRAPATSRIHIRILARIRDGSGHAVGGQSTTTAWTAVHNTSSQNSKNSQNSKDNGNKNGNKDRNNTNNKNRSKNNSALTFVSGLTGRARPRRRAASAGGATASPSHLTTIRGDSSHAVGG